MYLRKRKIITDINNYFDFRLTECIEKIREKEIQYCFVLDLYKIYQLSLWSQDYCEKVLDYYQQIFRFSDIERNFFETFSESAQKKDTEKAGKAYELFRKKGYEIRYSVMSYFFPEFVLEENYDNITVKAGKTFIIDKPTKVTGDIIVERGGSLLVLGGILKIYGSIITDGGRVRLYNARVRVMDNKNDYFMKLSKTAIVQITYSFIDCGGKCGCINQTTGRFILSDTVISNTSGERAVGFLGRSAVITRCRFVNCNAGALALMKNSRVNIENTEFINCMSEYGGSLYSESIGNVKVESCTFENSKAKYLGSAIYFKYSKFGQFVTNCTYKECMPEESSVFNVYDDDFEMQRL